MSTSSAAEPSCPQTKPSIDETQQQIIDEFASIGDPLSQYEYLLEFSAELPTLPASNKTDDNLVKGCQSRAWLILGNRNGAISIKADSETLIIRGVLFLLIEALDGQPLAEVARADIRFLEEANLMDTFTSSRRDGVHKIVERIVSYAGEHAGTAEERGAADEDA